MHRGTPIIMVTRFLRFFVDPLDSKSSLFYLSFEVMLALRLASKRYFFRSCVNSSSLATVRAFASVAKPKVLLFVIANS